jgi:tetratricopeptide (TPR) repeat protein
MPNRQTQTVEHIAFTDHSIPRRPVDAGTRMANQSLVPFWNSAVADLRDLALAYAVVAPTEPTARPRALELLQRAEAVSPQDVAVLAQLAQIYDRMGQEDKATALCERIVRIDPAQIAAATNLGSYYMKRGRAQEAISLWRNALTRNPGLTSARINLGVAQYRSGDAIASEATILKALEYDPDLDVAKRLLAEIQANRK